MAALHISPGVFGHVQLGAATPWWNGVNPVTSHCTGRWFVVLWFVVCVFVLWFAAADVQDVRPAARAADPLPELHAGVRDGPRSKKKKQLIYTCWYQYCYWLKMDFLRLCLCTISPLSFLFSFLSGCMYPSNHWGDWNDSQLLPTIQKLMKGYNRYLRPNFNGNINNTNTILYLYS